jgi:hypothetical protein
LNHATVSTRGKMTNCINYLVSSIFAVIEQLIHDAKFEGSTPVDTGTGKELKI